MLITSTANTLGAIGGISGFSGTLVINAKASTNIQGATMGTLQTFGCGTVNTYGTSVTWVSLRDILSGTGFVLHFDLDCGNDVGRLFRGIAHKTAPRPR